jgi:hypothetical protein
LVGNGDLIEFLRSKDFRPVEWVRRKYTKRIGCQRLISKRTRTWAGDLTALGGWLLDHLAWVVFSSILLGSWKRTSAETRGEVLFLSSSFAFTGVFVAPAVFGNYFYGMPGLVFGLTPFFLGMCWKVRSVGRYRRNLFSSVYQGLANRFLVPVQFEPIRRTRRD